MSAPESPQAGMRWAPALVVQAEDPALAARAGARSLRMELGDGAVDLVLAFFTTPFVSGADAIRSVLRAEFPDACIAGVAAAGVIGSLAELEGEPALALLAARLPGVRVQPFILPAEEWESPPADAETFALLAPGAAGAEIVFLIGDPASLRAEPVLESFRRFAPGVRIAGGLASAGVQPGTNALFLNDWTAKEGGVAIALSGALRVDTFVSQGCRPVGSPMAVTAAERNMIFELDGTRASERLQAALGRLGKSDRELARGGLHLGRPVVPNASGPADYVVRNFLGHDPESGALAVGDAVPAGERIRLLVRDPHAAFEDLSLLLAPQGFDTRAEAALLFACTGRGQSFHGRPNGDIDVVQRVLGNVPAAGMFCAGEFGPTAERNAVHGYAASVAIVRAVAPARE
jgi:small ligand-binding sensory domain FIST